MVTGRPGNEQLGVHAEGARVTCILKSIERWPHGNSRDKVPLSS